MDEFDLQEMDEEEYEEDGEDEKDKQYKSAPQQMDEKDKKKVINAWVEKNLPYKLEGSLVTGNEKRYFEKLLPLARTYNLRIAIKIRIADVIKFVPDEPYYKDHEDYKDVKEVANRKIMQKHVDFVLYNKKDLRPISAIEIDDPSHYDKKSYGEEALKKKEISDNFKNRVFSKVGLPLFRYRYSGSLDVKYVEKIENDIIIALAQTGVIPNGLIPCENKNKNCKGHYKIKHYKDKKNGGYREFFGCSNWEEKPTKEEECPALSYEPGLKRVLKLTQPYLDSLKRAEN